MSAAPSIGPLLAAEFVDRPNRFIVRCMLPGRGTVRAFMPNPGRLWELLFPGVRLYLTERPPEDSGRKTRFTVVAVDRDGEPIFLHTHLTNAVARHLLDHGRIESLHGAHVVRGEVPAPIADGPVRSRFDFLLQRGRADVYLEVKSCTLFGNEVAMFPDAVTERGRRHLLELAELARSGIGAAVVFIVHSPRVRWFMPDYHTDLAFSRTLLEVREQVPVIPVAVTWRLARDARSGEIHMRLARGVREVPIPWEYIDREAHDRGSYLLILRLPRRRRISVGSLGDVLFPAGYYVYVGSAMTNLDKRLARHLATRKRLHWHVDYLRQYATEVTALPIRSSTREEEALARAVSLVLESGPEGFGASDSDSPTHLFRSDTHPLHLPCFHEILQCFRMKHPE
ncbi:MAG: DNA/RNA nuclease SfsA [bacterium]|nr:DNA/RNA nuclease SfsA [bacterium]